jgi:hypothetical protein
VRCIAFAYLQCIALWKRPEKVLSLRDHTNIEAQMPGLM